MAEVVVDLEVAGRSNDVPSDLADQGVVEAAQEDAVLDACPTAAGPVNDVVDVAPFRCPVTPGEPAVASRAAMARRCGSGNKRC